MKILFAKMKFLLLLVAAFLGYHLGVANAAAIHETTSTRQTTITNSSTSKNWPRMQVKKETLEIGECPYKPQCTWDYAKYELTLSCTNFTYFSELNFTAANNTRIFDRIRIIPLKEQELTENNLNLEGLSIHSLGTIELANINKFYYRSSPLSRLNNAEKRFTLILKLVNCTFTFAYDHRTALNSVCNSNLINATQENRSHSLMSSANSVHIEGAKFVEPICPFLFHNVKMSNLYVTNPREHSFRFLDVQLDSRLIGPEANVKDVENTTVLNCRLRYLTFNGVTFTSLDFGVLSKFVFYNVRSMTFRNVVFKLINEKVFSNFPYLNQIELKPANWEYFVSNTNLDVLFRNLNSKPTHVDFNNTKAKVDLKSKISLHLDASSSQYDFPDSDFCRFAHFPFDLLVRTFVYTRDNNCTCTIKWLDQYAGKYPSDTDYGRSAGANCRKKTDCDFEALRRTCTVRQEKLVTASESNFNIRPLVHALLITVVVVFLVFVFVIVFRRVRAPPRRRAAAATASRRRPSKQSDSFQISYSVDNEETVLNRSDIPVTPDSTVIVGSSSKRTPAPGSKVVRKSKFYRAGQN